MIFPDCVNRVFSPALIFVHSVEFEGGENSTSEPKSAGKSYLTGAEGFWGTLGEEEEGKEEGGESEEDPGTDG